MDDTVVAAWAARAQAGDERVFGRLVESLTRPLIAMAYRYTGDWEWARDLTQDTWVRAYQHLDRYDPDRSFVSWLYAVHRNGCLDHARRAWVRRESAGHGEAELARLGGPAPDDPAADLERREFRRRVLEATRGLTDRERRVFTRVDLERDDRGEVADDLGMRPGTLRTTLHNARRKLARLLNPREDER